VSHLERIPAIPFLLDPSTGEAISIRFCELAEALPHPVCFKDADHRIRFLNRAAAALLGVGCPEDAKGKTARDLFPTEIAGRIDTADSSAIGSAAPSVESLESFPGPDGKTIWLHVVRVPLRDAGGKPAGLWLISREVTEERETEERLVALNADLFAALSNLKNVNEELRSIQSHLVETEKMHSIGRLAASVAHEVKNPLAIVRMGIECFAQEPAGKDPALAMVLSEMTDAVKRADAVIRGLLDFSAPAKMSQDECSLNDIIGRAISLVRGEAAARKCQVVAELDPDLPPANLDRLKVSQVFVNLFLNALHAMPPGGALSIRTFCKRMTAPEAADRFPLGSRVLVAEVDDTGPGIPPERLAKVFEPFFTTKPAGEGSGLGLAVSRSIVELHGGTLELDNRTGGGARATVTLRASDG
jgi:PAS domain S-box-containing protein